MKNLTKLFLIILFVSIPWSSYACDFLKIPIDTPIVNLINKYENLWEPDEDAEEDDVYQYTYRASDFCNDKELKKTYMLVYVKNAKFIGLKLKILHDDLEKDDLYRFTNSNIDSIDDKVQDIKKWYGSVRLDMQNRYVLFGKSKSYDSRLFETLLITTGEYADLIYGSDVIEVMM